MGHRMLTFPHKVLIALAFSLTFTLTTTAAAGNLPHAGEQLRDLGVSAIAAAGEWAGDRAGQLQAHD